jgi:hypothetical protein
MVPGRALHRLAKFLMPPHVCDQIVDAQLADFQHEWATAHGFTSRMLVLIRGYAAFSWSCVVCVARAMGRGPAEAGDRQTLVRVVAISILATGAMLALLSLPAFSHSPVPVHASAERMASWRRQRWWMVAVLFPSEVPLAVPVGLLLGLLVGLRKSHVSMRLTKTVLFWAFVCSITSFIVLGWVMPAANQSYRMAVFEAAGGGTGSPQRGGNELAMTEMLERVRTLRQEGETKQGLHLLFNYHMRWSLAAATLVLAIFGLFSVGRRRAVRMGLGFAVCAAYYLLWAVGSSMAGNGAIPVAALAWLPNAVVFALAIAVRGRGDQALTS